MRHGRTILVGAAAALLLASAPVSAQKGGGEDPPVTLTLAIADGQGRQSEPAVNDLVAKVSEASNGNITIEPTFSAGDNTEKGFEEGVADLVETGRVDLGMAATRAWDLAGVTSLQALQAPFLIDNDALALAVAKSDIATKAMTSMGNGVTGLALWPEDLRHLMSFPPGGLVFRTPADVEGALILVIPSGTARATVEALGGVVYQEGVTDSTQTGDRGGDSDSGVLKGMETGLWGAGLPRSDAIAVGDVVLFPKYQMLVANDQSLGKLTDKQRAIFDQAVREMREGAFGRQFGETDLAAKFCAAGGTVIDAGPGAEDAFRTLAQAVYQKLREDPLTAQLIEEITALKGQTSASPPAPECSPTSAPASPSANDPALADFVGTDIPDGSYRAAITQQELIDRGVAANWAGDNWGTKTWTFNHGAVTFDQGEQGGAPCYGAVESKGGAYLSMVSSGGGCGIDGRYVWKPVDGGIVLRVPNAASIGADGKFYDAFLDRTWTLVPPSPGATPAPASELPAVGTWRSHRSMEELLRFLPADKAAGRDGEYTLSFDGTRWSAFETCGGPYGLENGYLHLVYELDPANCGTPPLNLIWVNAGPGLAYVSGAPGTGDVDKATVTGSWTRISELVPTSEPGSSVSPEPSSAIAGYSGELPPVGTYRADMSDLVARGATEFFAATNAGTWTWTFARSGWITDHTRPSGVTEHCEGTYSSDSTRVRFVTDDARAHNCGMDYDIVWKQTGDGLDLGLLGLPIPGVAGDLPNEVAFIQRHWTRIDANPGATDEPASSSSPDPAAYTGSIPSDGTYRATITIDDLVARGANPSYATDNAGTFTLVFKAGTLSVLLADGAGTCQPTIASVDDVMRVTFTGQDDCDTEVLDLQSQLIGDQLYLRAVALDPPDGLADERAVFERAWTRIE